MVLKCLEDGVDSNQKILNKINQNNLPQITKKQLNNLKSRFKANKYGKSQSTLSSIIEWCEQRKNIPNDDDEVFCGDYKYDLNEDDQVDTLCVFVTTKRLVSLTQLRSN